MMPVWGWVALVALVGLFGMWVGDRYGFFVEENVAPSERAYIEVAEHEIDAKKEVALHSIDMEHEEQMALIKRGVFDVQEQFDQTNGDGSEKGGDG